MDSGDQPTGTASYWVAHWRLLICSLVVTQTGLLAASWWVGVSLGVLWTLLIVWMAYLLIFKVDHRMDLFAGVLQAETALIHTVLPIPDITAVEPGWRQPLWRRYGTRPTTWGRFGRSAELLD